MTTVLLVGAGAVGVRAGRQLVDTPGVEQLLVTARGSGRASQVADALGAQAVPFGELPAGLGAIALALPGAPAATIARAAVDAGVPVAAACDDEEGLTELRALDDAARSREATVVLGCALAPGLTDVLARHAANLLDEPDEVHVARAGTAGPACTATLRRARREKPLEWGPQGVHEARRAGAQLVWFPDPVGARECVTIAGGAELLPDAVPGVRRATIRAADAPPTRRFPPARRNTDDEWGAARVEVWGWRDGRREAVVYGVIERPAVAAGTVLAVTVARIAGCLPDLQLRDGSPGARSLGALVEPAPFLGELARRGVKAAAFEGVPVA